MEALLNFLQSIHPLSEQLVAHLSTILKIREVPKKSYLLKAEQVSRNIYFIEKGLVRCFYLKHNHEVTSWFMKEGDVIVSVQSFFNQVPGEEYIQTLEDCTLYYIEFGELEYIYNHFSEFNYIGRRLLQKYYILEVQHTYSLNMLRAPERYAYLMEHARDLILRVPAKYIASYLGITEVTLSKIKGRL